MNILFQGTGVFSEITVAEVSELYGEKGRFRTLQFSGEAVQGAADLDRPERVVFEYPRAMLHLMEHNGRGGDDVFMVGCGAGTIIRHGQGLQVTAAEADPLVAEAAVKWFGVPADRIAVGDGRALLEQRPDASLDFIVLDAFTAEGTPQHLATLEFVRLTECKLRPDGALLINLMGRKRNDARVGSVYAALTEVYPYTRSLLLPSAAYGEGDLHNILLAGSGRPLSFQERQMAGFQEFRAPEGYVIRDAQTWTQGRKTRK